SDVTHHDGRLAQFNAIADMQVSLELSLDDDALGIDIGLHLPVRADRQVISLQQNAAFDLAVEIQVLAAGKLSLDDDGLADMREFSSLGDIHDLLSLGKLPSGAHK